MKVSKRQIIEMIAILEPAISRVYTIEWNNKHIIESIDNQTSVIFTNYGANDYSVSVVRKFDTKTVELSIILKKGQPIESYGLQISTKTKDFYTTVKREKNLTEKKLVIKAGEYD